MDAPTRRADPSRVGQLPAANPPALGVDQPAVRSRRPSTFDTDATAALRHAAGAAGPLGQGVAVVDDPPVDPPSARAPAGAVGFTAALKRVKVMLPAPPEPLSRVTRTT